LADAINDAPGKKLIGQAPLITIVVLIAKAKQLTIFVCAGIWLATPGPTRAENLSEAWQMAMAANPHASAATQYQRRSVELLGRPARLAAQSGGERR
jgi:hypothetical protein